MREKEFIEQNQLVIYKINEIIKSQIQPITYS